MKNEDFVEIEAYINDSALHHTFFDKFLEQYPNSDYLLGMKISHMIDYVDIDTIQAFLTNYYRSNSQFRRGTFTILAESMIARQLNNDSLVHKLLKESQSMNRNYKNRYTLLDLYLFYRYIESDLEKADQYFDLLKKHHPNYTEYLLGLADQLFLQGDDTEAIRVLDKIIKENGNPLACLDRSDIHYKNGDFTSALMVVNIGLEKWNSPELYCQKGIIFEAIEKLDSALASYKMAIEIDPNCKIAHEKLGWYYINHQNDFSSALESFYRMKDCEPVQTLADFNHITYAYLLTLKTENVKEMIDTAENLFGKNHQTDFFRIVLFSLNNDISGIHELLDEFMNSYDEETNKWLIQELSSWNIIIKTE